MSKPSERPDVIELNIPREEGVGTVGLVYRLVSMLSAVIADSSDNKYFKINHMTNLLINTILDPKERARVIQFKKDLIAEGLSELDSPSDDEINNLYIDACMTSVGEVMNYVDEFLGVSKKLEVALL